VDTAYFALKATFEVDRAGVRVSAKQAPLVLAEEYWGEPGASSLKRATEAHLCKPSTDIVVLGSAYAPRGLPATVFDVSVSVGDISKRLRIFGDRVWVRSRDGRGVVPSAPQPVDKVPLVYEKAFGGLHKVDESTTLYEARNPVGVGFAGKRSAGELAGLPLPNIEDPSELFQKPGQTPRPVGLGFVAPSWQPRLAFAGTYDAEWQKRRAPYLPKDFNPKYFQAAHEDLVAASPLRGGEPVELLGLSPSGLLRFAVPRVEFDVEARLAGQPRQIEMKMETLVVEPDENRLTLFWRGNLPCDKQALHMERVRFQVRRLEGVVS
jgi:hypothetical protein